MAAKTSPFSLRKFKRSLDSDGPENIYFFYGKEEERISQAVKAVKSTILKDADPEFGWRVYDMTETPLGDLLADIRTPSFFASRRGVVIKDILIKRGRPGANWLDETAQRHFLDYLDNPSPDVVLIIIAEELDGRSKFWKELKKLPSSICFDTNERGQKAIVAEKLEESGLRFTPQAKLWIAERFFSRLSHIDSELAKLDVYMGGKGKVDVADMEECMAAPPIDSIFKLADAVAQSDLDASLRAMKSLRMQGETFYMILPMIARHFRILLTIRSCRAQGLSDYDTRVKSGIRFYFDKYSDMAGRFTADQLKSIIYSLHRTDLRIRMSGMDNWMLLEEELLSSMKSTVGTF